MTILHTFFEASVIDERKVPVANIASDPTFAVMGSIVRLDGQTSTDPFNLPLSYTWSFITVPIGSGVVQEGFRILNEDGGLVSFSPDIVGEYIIGLKVSNGAYESDIAQARISVRAILVPHGRGLVPDGKFIWSYIRDVWQQVQNKEWFETLWSALIQIAGSELLKLYQNDFNKSIRDIQDQYQRRWIDYEPKLKIDADNCSFFLGNHCAGTDATTENVGLTGQAILLNSVEMLIVTGSVVTGASGFPLRIFYDTENPTNIHDYVIGSTNAPKTGYKLAPPTISEPAPIGGTLSGGANVSIFFSYQSQSWSLISNSTYNYALLDSEQPYPHFYLLAGYGAGGPGVAIRVGDVVRITSGVNSGIYKITSISGNLFTVDRKPLGSSDAVSTTKCDFYRPVGVRVFAPSLPTTDTLSYPFDSDGCDTAPGRIIVIGGQAFEVIRTFIDNNQIVPVTIITVDEDEILSNRNGLSWRTPHSLSSTTQDFEALGVTTGDTFLIDVFNANTSITSTFVAQVIGVHKNLLGFVLTYETV